METAALRVQKAKSCSRVTLALKGSSLSGGVGSNPTAAMLFFPFRWMFFFASFGENRFMLSLRVIIADHDSPWLLKGVLSWLCTARKKVAEHNESS